MQRTVSPVDGSVYVERKLFSGAELEHALERATQAQRALAAMTLSERRTLCARLCAHMIARAPALAEQLSYQMGRPIRDTPGELTRGFAARSEHMLEIAEASLADEAIESSPSFRRFLRHEPHGVVLVLAPWNYPYLTSVNAVVPALCAGNSVLLKHSDQTPLCAEHYEEAARAVGFPDGALQAVCADHQQVARLIRDPRVGFVAFTGSVEGGRAVMRAASERFVGVGLELGGKDPGYVRADADLDAAIENLVDGAMYNAGQSCCAIERIYVHAAHFDRFVEGAVELTRRYVLGNPLEPTTTLGPLVRTRAADFVRAQIDEAVARGARALIDEKSFERSKPGTPYLAPQILVNVDHGMAVMREESFGPVVGIMRVDSDEQAVALMNDSRYGLTASIWTRDAGAALAIGSKLETGTCFMNRCDYLDPALAWTGVKDSGRGVSLSRLGFLQLTRPKSFHLKLG